MRGHESYQTLLPWSCRRCRVAKASWSTKQAGMFSSASSTYSLKRPARCIAALAPNEESGEEQENNISSRFVVGTCSLREGNELHVLGFHEESNELLCHQVGRGATACGGERVEAYPSAVSMSESKSRARVTRYNSKLQRECDRRRFRRTLHARFWGQKYLQFRLVLGSFFAQGNIGFATLPRGHRPRTP